MKLKELARLLQVVNGGEFHNVEWERVLKTRKGIDDVITKRSKAVLRMGVNYDHKQAVKTKREVGILPSENQGLPYGQWRMFPYLIKHNDKLQLRVTTAQNTVFKTQYFKNGQLVEKSEIIDSCLKSETQSSDSQIDVFNLKIENIISIK